MFNDIRRYSTISPGNDAVGTIVDDFEKGIFTGIDLNFERNLESDLASGGVNEDKGWFGFGKWGYALRESGHEGDMDYYQDNLPYNRLYVAGSVAYNNYDAGNFLWGMGMDRLGFWYSSVQLASEAYAFCCSNYYFAKGWRQYTPNFSGDTSANQRAILHGYQWSDPFNRFYRGYRK